MRVLRPLRDYQTDVVDRAALAFRNGRKSVCVVLATGAGKTRCAVECSVRHIKSYGAGASIVWLAPLTQLVDQAKLAFPSDVTVVTSTERSEPQETIFPRVHVSTVHALSNTGYRPRATMVVVDEAQYFFGTPQWNKVIRDYLAMGARVLSLTATPARADGTPLDELADELVIGPSIQKLTDWRGPNGERALVPCKVIGPDKGADVLCEDPVEAYKTYADGTKAAVFCQDVAHSKAIAQRFNDAGISAVSVDSKDRDGIDGHRSGDVKVLCNVFLLSVGYDDPSIETIIMARGCSNVSTYLQIVGRGLRAHGDKTHCTLLDLRGVVRQYNFGLPSEPREYSLHGRAIKLVRKSKKREDIKSCESCKVLFRPGSTTCDCKAEIVTPKPPTEIEIRRMTLQEIHATEPPEKQRSYFDKQVMLARVRGHKPGRAMFMFKSKYGFFPPREWMV